MVEKREAKALFLILSYRKVCLMYALVLLSAGFRLVDVCGTQL
jgi:hypothetical protein